MIAASVYIPKWLAKTENEQKNNFATISYVAVPYSTISDSAIKVSDDDIKTYVDKNKIKYKQDGGMMISYVSFSATANGKDSAAIKQSIEELKPKFQADSNASSFVARNSSTINYSNDYVQKSKLQAPSPAKDSIITAPIGAVVGPYLDGKNYVLAKIVSLKQVPDSVTVRHILIKISDSKKGEVRADTTARKLIDSIALAIKDGADFNQMVLKYSDDDGSKNTKGEYKFSSSSQLVDSFYQTSFYFPVGTKRIVKGESQDYTGYHYIEVLDQSKFQPAYKIAYMAKDLAPSDETINVANAAAIKLAGQARDKQAFDKYAAQNGLKEVSVPTTIKENDFQLGGLQDAREIVRWAFNAKEGDVSDPFSMKDAFVVATVDRKIEEGTPDVKTARPLVESAIINMKKADEIKKKLSNPATLDAAAKAASQQVLTTGTDSTLTFDAQLINGIGNEPKVAGAAFNKEYQTKVSPLITGNTGVFVIKVNSITPKAPLTAEMMKQRTNAEVNQSLQSATGQSFASLKKMANIKDYRSKFF
jgi:peptidyl-prolyl cis-trans isomerase D